MPLADWTVPFTLTSTPYTSTLLSLNTPTVLASGDSSIFYLRPDGCQLNATVRQTKDNVPQADGSILHRRFMTGMEMNLVVQMWQDNDKIACDSLLEEMLDLFMGYAYGLLNAGDNEGRISWAPTFGSSVSSTSRMLEDIRLLSYPVETQQPGSPYEVALTVDSVWPYAADLTQLSPSLSGGSGTVLNLGNRPTYPVWKIYGPYDAFVLTDTSVTPNAIIRWDQTLPGAGAALTNAEYIEIDTFRNSVTKVAAGPVLSNVAAGIDMTASEFFTISPGSHSITVSYTSGNATNNNSSVALINAAFA
jgi:hypothetical protein